MGVSTWVVLVYKYLGMTLNPYGNFSLAREELKKVGLKAVYKLTKEMGDNFRENIMLTIKTTVFAEYLGLEANNSG